MVSLFGITLMFLLLAVLFAIAAIYIDRAASRSHRIKLSARMQRYSARIQRLERARSRINCRIKWSRRARTRHRQRVYPADRWAGRLLLASFACLLLAVAPQLKVQTGLPQGEQILEGLGTAFLVGDGLLFTNEHVVKKCEALDILREGRKYSAVVVAKNAQTDIALLKVEEGLDGDYLPLKPWADVTVGEAITSLGYPSTSVSGYDLRDRSGPRFGSGIISGLVGSNGKPFDFQVSVSGTSGSSGSPILNSEGFVIGIRHSSAGRGSGLAYATRASMMAVMLAEHGYNAPATPPLSGVDVLSPSTRASVMPVVCYAQD